MVRSSAYEKSLMLVVQIKALNVVVETLKSQGDTRSGRDQSKK